MLCLFAVAVSRVFALAMTCSVLFLGTEPQRKTSSVTEQVIARAKTSIEIVMFLSLYLFQTH